jgi:DNA-binding transcriptional LysR family regulator
VDCAYQTQHRLSLPRQKTFAILRHQTCFSIHEYSTTIEQMETFDLATLRQFLALARHQNLSDAASELHLSPSALSKGLKRLELALQTTLFDRQGRNLRLNADGARLLDRAAALMASADQMRSEFLGTRGSFHCRISGPALLQLNWGRRIASLIGERFPGAQVAFGNEKEDEALSALARGEADLALVTTAALGALDPRHIALNIGLTRFEVAVGANHPLTLAGNGPRATVTEVLKYPFVVPTQPPFRGLQGGPATDGWRDDQQPRIIRYRSDDLLLVDGLVRAGLALAYLPDYALAELQLLRLDLTDNPFSCTQQVVLVYRPSTASGWLNYVVEAMKSEAVT